MALIWKDGSILWEAGSIANSTACCCAAPSTPVACTPCTFSSSASAPPTVEVVSTGGDWPGSTGTFILDFSHSDGTYCVYNYSFAEPYPSCTPSDAVPRTLTNMRVFLKTTEAQFGWQPIWYFGGYTVHTYTSAPCNTTRSLDMGSKTSSLGAPCANLPHITVNI